MNAATKEAYKELAESVWGVVKAIGCVAALLLAGCFASAGDYERATFNMIIALLLKD